MAGETIELAKPVIGTMRPAPTCLAMSSYRLTPVKMAEMAISVIVAYVAASGLAAPSERYSAPKSSPTTQTMPPNTNAMATFFTLLDLGERAAMYFEYSSVVIFICCHPLLSRVCPAYGI